MSPDLDTKIRDYGERLDGRAASLETLVQRAVSAGNATPAARSRWILATGAAAILVVAIGGVAVLTGLFSGGGQTPTAATPPGPTLTLQDGTWQHTVLPAGLHVGDVEATSFGLVAAATTEGIWISADGVEWEQVFVGPHGPFSGTTSTLTPPLTAPPPPGNVETYIRHVAEYEGALYAAGTNATGINGPDMTGRMIVYRSEDGQNWEETVIKETGSTLAGIHPIDLVATDSGLVVYAEGISSAMSLFRSEDGRTWTELNPDETGLASVGILDGVTPYSAGFIAVAEDTSLSEEEPTQVVYRSAMASVGNRFREQCSHGTITPRYSRPVLQSTAMCCSWVESTWCGRRTWNRRCGARPMDSPSIASSSALRSNR